ncbi:GIY-YIG nuclease family protein, partial [Candidatus Kaiserbacteria bacterium]|nr:GIY-YIG nuclease family protein [Candidatus Kaiserbacteria bacterium]
NLERRFAQHLDGHTHSTKRLRAEEIIFSQEYKSLKEARSVEHKIKKLKRKDYIEKMIKDGYIALRP